MASDGPPGADSNTAINTWTHGELQAKLAEFGAPNMGPREELIDRLKSYAQSGMILTKPNMQGGDDKVMTTTMPGLPPMPPMPSMPLPPGMNMMQAMNMMGGPPPIHMGMMQHDDRAAQGDSRGMDEQMKEQELLEQQKRAAAVLLEHERQQELAKIQQGAPPGTRGPELGPRPNLLPPIPPLRVGTQGGPTPPGVSLLLQSANQRQKVPPPPGEDARESWPGEDVGIGPKIPQALEKILQLKEMRQEQLSIAPTEEGDEEEMDMNNSSARGYSDEDDESGLSKKDKNRKRRNRKKKNKKKRQQQEEEKKKEESREKEPEVEIEYVTEEPAVYDPNYIIFKRIFETFKLTDDVKKEKEKEPEKPEKPEILSFKKKGFELEKKDSDDSDEEARKDMPKLSKKKLRRMNRLTVAELKQLVARPDVVEMHDVTAQEPKLLVHLKATRNTVPVPRHWCFKRKYLQGKRGIEKPPFELPEFIKRTGIQEMREALQEKVQSGSDIFLIRCVSLFQGCSFGYHAGGWGKPPVDETGRPLYGDVFGTNAIDFHAKAEEEEVDRTTWGELEASDEESSEEEEEEEESDEEKPDETGFFTPADSGMITPGGFSSVPAGMETPELIELRKKKIEEAMDGNETPQLFTVLPERRTGPVGAAMMASTHIYDMSTTVTSRKVGGVSVLGGDSQGVEVALAPEELELDPMAMTQKYEEHVREQQVEKEDFSDMVAEHAAKQKQKKRKAQPQDTRSGAKKYKEFKF
ncbi:splicing factor 3B subunit 2-like [Sinocyclocheilus grahami]|uniref:splicing factor 3B subunit 2-like n=1 Tax=Sinocyclocheilus grahami TaxID=75366 RepID=UPI0007ACD686|nr:PREDICTED: splicing factor 3B subunit 2-like [Sinocyclocheilus grahami]